MIRCNKCGYVGSYYGPKCPSCKETFDLTPEEIEEKIRLAILPALIEGKGRIKGDKAFKILNLH